MNERGQMSDRREDSVLVALKELRGIEDDRVRKEKDEARARVEAERAAKEASERRAREEEQARLQAEEDRVRRLEEDKQARAREEQLRVEEAERRARVDGEMKLQHERKRLEIQSRAGRSPLKAVVGVALAVALVGGVILYKVNASHNAELAAREKRAEEDRTSARAAQAELEKRLTAITHDMDEKLRAAKTEAEKAQIRAEAAAAKREAAAEEKPGRTRTKRADKGDSDKPTKAPGLHVPGKREISDGILDGL